MKESELISSEMLLEQRRLHAMPRGYGGKGYKWARIVHQLAALHGCRDFILDYGCGQNSLARALNEAGLKTRSYDPAIDEFARAPEPADFVVCTDVLEHIEIKNLPAVLADLQRVTKRTAFFVISTVETSKTLSDGRSAHVTVHDSHWWMAKLRTHFNIVKIFNHPDFKPQKQLVVVVQKKDIAT